MISKRILDFSEAVIYLHSPTGDGDKIFLESSNLLVLIDELGVYGAAKVGQTCLEATNFSLTLGGDGDEGCICFFF